MCVLILSTKRFLGGNPLKFYATKVLCYTAASTITKLKSHLFIHRFPRHSYTSIIYTYIKQSWYAYSLIHRTILCKMHKSILINKEAVSREKVSHL